MIWLITYYDEDLKCECVSHGVDDDTGRDVVLQPTGLEYYKHRCHAIFHEGAGMWYLT